MTQSTFAPTSAATSAATTLRSVTLQTVANYTQAAECAVQAYRVGGHRLIAAVQRGVDRATVQGPERLSDVVRRASGNVGDLAIKGVDAVSKGSERAIELGSNGLTAQVTRVADLIDGVDNRIVVNGLQAVSRVSLPGAHAALALSKRVAAVAHKLPGTTVDGVKAQAKTAVRKISKVAKAGAPFNAAATRRAAAKADASVQAVVQQAAATGKKAKKAVAPVIAEVSAALTGKATRTPAIRQQATRTAGTRMAQAKAVAKPVVTAVKTSTAKASVRARRAAKTSPVAQAVAALDAVIANA